MEVAAASSELHSEGCFEGGTTGDFFAVEDLLDFSGDQMGEEGEDDIGPDEVVKGPDPDSDVSSSSTATAPDAGACDAANLDGAGGLCPLPYEEQELNAELEWLSGHLDEDEPVLPTEDIQKLRLISGSGATNTPSSYASPSSSSSSVLSSSSNTSADRCSSSSYSTSSNDSTLHRHLLPIHDEDSVLMPADHSNDSIDASAVLPQSLPWRGARSKRSRADPGSWASRLAALLTSKAADELGVLHADYGCSSSSSYGAATEIVPFAPAADTQRKKLHKPAKPHKTIIKPPQRQQPPPFPSGGFYADDEPAAADARRCLHCATDKTPQWRTGPMGPKTLCNACGVRYKSGRLVPEYRPAASPTFVMSKHSNSHRKVMELRRQKESRHHMPATMRHRETDIGADDGGGYGTGTFSPFLHQHISRSSTAHMFPLPAVDGMYVDAAAAAPPEDFLIHHAVGPDFRQLI